MNTYAPVLIPTLCRFEHFIRCIESLQKNAEAQYTELYIGLDYPTKASHKEGYEKIKKFLNNGIEGFLCVHIFEHEKNMGAANNSDFLMKEAGKKHDRWIYTEDDNEFSSNYLEYMNRCLEEYTNDKSVVAVTGFNYPIDMDGNGGNIYFNSAYFAAFGFGTWTDKYNEMQSKITTENFRLLYQNRRFMNALKHQAFNQYGNFVKGMLGYIPDLLENDTIRMVDLAYGIYMFSEGKKMVFPLVSKVRNWGYDGTGVNCGEINYNGEKKITHRNFDMSCQKLDSSKDFPQIKEAQVSQQVVNKYVAEFFEIPLVEKIKVDIVYICSRILGIELIRGIFNRK